MSKTLYVGVGNPHRRDDGVGPWLATALGRAGRHTRIHSGDGTGLIDLFSEHPRIVLMDATRSGSSPGTVRTFDAVKAALPTGVFQRSTHLFGLAEAVETARALGALPPALYVLGVEGGDFTMGEGLTPPVAAAARNLVARMRQTDGLPAPV